MLEMHEIRYFLTLSETLNFTRAAQACSVTQPALTRAIKALEDKLGGPLVHRERGNTHLTELGRKVQPLLRDAFERVAEARKVAEDFTHMRSATLRVGVMCTIGPHNLVGLLRGFLRLHDGISLFMRDGPALAIEEELLRGDLDLAIYGRPGAVEDGLHRLPLYTERMMIALSAASPLAGKADLRLEDLHGLAYVSRANCEYDDHIDRICMARGIAVHTVYRSERDDWVQSIVMSGIGFTFIPEHSITIPGLVCRPLTDPAVSRSIVLATVRGRPHSRAVAEFVKACRSYPWTDRLGGYLRPDDAGEG
jgi:DNA-binding transcriptional LysR family regulator